ncbi:MAG TPA: acetyltransferase [Longimicrobiaceae bacterium]|nr:acetyltransferase [Longimicrobiaceae bacterium]
MLVVGAGGHGKSIVSVLLACGTPVAGVLDDGPERQGGQVQGVPVLGPVEDLDRYPGRQAVIGLGDNAQRRAVAERFPAVEWVRVIHPGVYLNPTASVGPGTVVFPGAIIGADAAIGAHVIVSGHTTIGHDTTLHDYVQVAPGVQVAGGVLVEEGAMLGIGSIVCPSLRIGAWATLGAGAVAVRDLPAGCVAFGMPARPRVR